MSLKQSRIPGVLALFMLLTTVSLLAQMPEGEVRKRLDFIYNGQAERVRIELPGLEKQYVNDPGVAYLDAILTTDGAGAVKKFQAIVDQFPQNEWADDALYKVYQYYYSVGLYKTADEKLGQLKQQYPNSLYVVGTAIEKKPSPKTEEPVQKTPPPPVNEHKPEIQPRADTVAAPVSGKFAVQAGAFSTIRNARKQVDFFSSIGRAAIITTKAIGGKTLYVVSIEGFTSERAARAFISELKAQHNIESIIVAR